MFAEEIDEETNGMFEVTNHEPIEEASRNENNGIVDKERELAKRERELARREKELEIKEREISRREKPKEIIFIEESSATEKISVSKEAKDKRKALKRSLHYEINHVVANSEEYGRGKRRKT